MLVIVDHPTPDSKTPGDEHGRARRAEHRVRPASPSEERPQSARALGRCDALRTFPLPTRVPKTVARTPARSSMLTVVP